MPNHLRMDTVQAIHALNQQGWSQRKIARELGIHRSTVAAHLGSKPAGPPSGRCPPTGSEVKEPGSEERTRSQCEPWRDVVLEKLNQGLSAQRIYQDLTSEHDFPHGYDSVKRFVRALQKTSELPFRRLECEPGAEAQIDFGRAAAVIDGHGKRRRPHLLRIVLSHSRKGYTEAIERQTTENFIRCLENAFWHFGGVPQTLVIDNLRTAVTKADWFDPELIQRRAPVQGQFEFLDEHTAIRPLVFFHSTQEHVPATRLAMTIRRSLLIAAWKSSEFVQSALRKEQNR